MRFSGDDELEGDAFFTLPWVTFTLMDVCFEWIYDCGEIMSANCCPTIRSPTNSLRERGKMTRLQRLSYLRIFTSKDFHSFSLICNRWQQLQQPVLSNSRARFRSKSWSAIKTWIFPASSEQRQLPVSFSSWRNLRNTILCWGRSTCQWARLPSPSAMDQVVGHVSATWDDELTRLNVVYCCSVEFALRSTADKIWAGPGAYFSVLARRLSRSYPAWRPIIFRTTIFSLSNNIRGYVLETVINHCARVIFSSEILPIQRIRHLQSAWLQIQIFVCVDACFWSCFWDGYTKSWWKPQSKKPKMYKHDGAFYQIWSKNQMNSRQRSTSKTIMRLFPQDEILQPIYRVDIVLCLERYCFETT